MLEFWHSYRFLEINTVCSWEKFDFPKRKRENEILEERFLIPSSPSVFHVGGMKQVSLETGCPGEYLIIFFLKFDFRLSKKLKLVFFAKFKENNVRK